MQTLTDHESSGIRDPYRSILILLGGVLLALALLVGQTGYRDDLPLSRHEAPRNPVAAGLQVTS
jgi:hypothetical protein